MKCDLASRKVVSTDGAEELANFRNIRLLEASSKNSHNVEAPAQAVSALQLRPLCFSFLRVSLLFLVFSFLFCGTLLCVFVSTHCQWSSCISWFAHSLITV